MLENLDAAVPQWIWVISVKICHVMMTHKKLFLLISFYSFHTHTKITLIAMFEQLILILEEFAQSF